MKKIKKIAIFGACGFIGTNLSFYLLRNKRNKVYAFDNLQTGAKSNLFLLNKYNNFSFFKFDLTKNSTKNLDKFDLIINLACPASPIYYQADPVKTLLTSVIGTHKLLEKSRNDNSIYIHSSTSEIYGDPIISPQKESYFGNVNPFGPRSCYDEGKRAAESLCYDFINQYNTDARIIRIFNTYGPYMRYDDGRVISNFIIQSLKGSPITIYGDGLQTRSFCYIDDLINAIQMLFYKKVNMPINLGNPKEFDMIKVAKKILSLTNSSSELIFKPLPKDDPKQRKPDISLAKKYLNWAPKINLELGLCKTIDYFKKII